MGQRPAHRLLSPRLVSFGLVGLSGVFVNLGVLFLLAEVLHAPPLAASAAAIEISILTNFLLNNALTFRDRNAAARAGFGGRMLRYNLVGLAGLAVQLATFAALTRVGVWIYLAQLAGIALGMAVNFATNFYWTWQQHEAIATRGDQA